MNILKKEELMTKMDGEFIKGYVLIKSYTKQPTKNGGSYIGGVLEAVGSMQFKVWSNADCFEDLDKYDYSDCICFVSGKVNIYNGSYSLVIETCRAIKDGDEGLSKSDFFEEKYSAESYWKNLMVTLEKNVSAEAMQVFNLIVTEDVKERFCTEFAAVSHHDNCRSGLLAHTAKIVKMCNIIKVYHNIVSRVSIDLLFVGAALHDIGKIEEYSNGVISDLGKIVSHNILGIMKIEENKDKIVELKGEEFYYGLASIIATHHGEYGEPPRTVGSYVIHLIDCLESNLTSVNQLLESVGEDGQIIVGGLKLS